MIITIIKKNFWYKQMCEFNGKYNHLIANNFLFHLSVKMLLSRDFI